MRNESMRRNRPAQSWPGYDQRDDGWSDNRSERWAQDDWQAESEGNDWESRWRRAQMTPYQLSEGGPPRGAFQDDDTYGTGYGREAGREDQQGRQYSSSGSSGYGEGRYSGEQYTSGQPGRGQYGRAQGGSQYGRSQYGREYGGGGYGGESRYGSEYGSEYGGQYGGQYGRQPGGYGAGYGRGQQRGDWRGRGESSTRRNEYRTDPWQSGYSGAAALETGTGPSYATGTRGDEWSEEDERYGGTTTWRGGQRSGMRNRDQDWLREAERSSGYSNMGTSTYGWDRFDDDWPGRNYAVPEHRYGGDYREEWSGHEAGRQSAGELSYGGGYGGYGSDGGYRRSERYERDERDDDREEHGPLYNIGRRIGEAVSEFFGTDDRPQRRVGPKGYRRSDERIREAVCERLAYAEGLDVSEVTVDVNGGIVKLGGTVRDRREKYDIEDLVDNVFGVTDVENDIRVRRDSGEAPAKMDDLKGWTPD
ncbi:BON domain-containing protein [Cupriavidus gilardii]|uniref:BON domain-containing protein n=1 Tax=Cupriavidus gilardii TaxID=82541 RepID=UPI001FCA138D|nr:BON domain-containing protein [Cupriavidus gilardii]